MARCWCFKGDSPKVAEDFANADPYVLNGVIKSWRVREWTTVVGDDAAVKIDAACALVDR